ncbi:hypothetical protein [Ornithobacterium rhinotracheale]|uniref:Uncharacterized protein n=1 Tax=Ornithobacterium rhinotracheale (strain ATCC 51463 / DSM 15997 / CCUG 23171 / CIP 104009 / LMG 9086) TaxID=867902 RepID=I3ZZ53_ORNRL|nr:hypothetical protein [Ornithobacterium rhinotracheale]AFL96987.1 hypothetical protein Ornrh_0791 [Ornithobacterium rhinotracheale DSM 15997]MCK0194494.1 hypothetical protein [Ornithobacterium rhinotracheale]MCK0199540.1 hypothetical protein [Ornithobacterium rhinotracheale]UOH65386.1 hypothetical protein MT999_09315 [Ornithobacterium rhinotracheale]UVD88082.1 hypothetical protein NV236_04295 [Ornithobacterium rhinotracheale]
MSVKHLSILLLSIFLNFMLLQSVSTVCGWGTDIVVANVEEEKPIKSKPSIVEEEKLIFLYQQFITLSSNDTSALKIAFDYSNHLYQEPYISIPNPPPDLFV